MPPRGTRNLGTKTDVVFILMVIITMMIKKACRYIYICKERERKRERKRESEMTGVSCVEKARRLPSSFMAVFSW